MKNIFSETNHSNANTFLLILITIVIIFSIYFFINKSIKNKRKNKAKKAQIENITREEMELNKSIYTTGFINF